MTAVCRKTLLPFLLSIIPQLLLSVEFIATSRHDFEARLPIVIGKLEIFPSEKMKLLREKDDRYLVEYSLDERTYVLAIEKYDDSGRRLAYPQGGIVQPTTTYFGNFTEEYALVVAGMTYDVLKGGSDSEKLTIRIPVSGRDMALTVPAMYFSVESRAEKLAQAESGKRKLAERVANRAAAMGEYQDGEVTLTGDSLIRESFKEINQQFRQWDLSARSAAKHNGSVRAERYLRDPVEALCHIRSASGRGTGFLMAMNGRVYVVTNIHVVLSDDPFEIVTSSGQKLDILKIELAKDRDLARISIRGPALALPHTDYVKLDDEIAAYGDSGGAGVMTIERGKVLGISSSEIEVDAQIISGNSGGPIVKSGNLVVGVASRAQTDGDVQDWVKSGTRYLDVRRFGVRLSNDIEWQPVHPEALRAINTHLDDVFHPWARQSLRNTMWHYLRNPMATLPETDTGNSNLNSWKGQHNNLVQTHHEKMRLGGRLEEKLVWLEAMRNRSHAIARGLSLTAQKNADSLNALQILPQVGFISESRNQQIRFWESQTKEIKAYLPRVLAAIDRNIDTEIHRVQARLQRKRAGYR